MTGFRKSLMISAALHAGLLAATLIVLRAPPAHQTALMDSIPLELVDDISEDAQRAGEQRAERSETPQPRETPQPTPRPDPTPVPPPERPRPVDPSSAPAVPPPPSEQAAEPPRPAPPIPTPPARPPAPQQVARADEPPDEEGLLRRIEEDRQREQEQRQQQEEQRRQREERERQQREARERQQREAREREQREAREREQRERRERQQREARERRERERQVAQQQQQFDAQRISDIINRQEGAPQPQSRQGQTRTASLGNPRGTGQRLTQSQMALLAGMIRDQIAPCWSPPPGPQGANRAVVRIELLMNRDGSFNARPRVMNASSDPGFRPLADSAVRAIERCARNQGNKLNLPAEMYDVPNGWREIEFAFDPSQMM